MSHNKAPCRSAPLKWTEWEPLTFNGFGSHPTTTASQAASVLWKIKYSSSLLFITERFFQHKVWDLITEPKFVVQNSVPQSPSVSMKWSMWKKVPSVRAERGSWWSWTNGVLQPPQLSAAQSLQGRAILLLTSSKLPTILPMFLSTR